MRDLLLVFQDYTFQVVAIGAAMMGMVSGVLGSFMVLRRQSLLGDGVSHAALPGVVLAFMLTGQKNTEILLSGALLFGLLAAVCIHGIIENSRVKFDSALALMLSSFFGLGLMLLTFVQRLPNANQAGLNRFLFGQVSTILRRDVTLMAVCSIILLCLVLLFWKEFKLLTFDRDFAFCLGFPVSKLNLLLTMMTVLSIIIGLQTVGVILMSAMLISPAVAARQWTDRLGVMVMLAALFGGISGVAGTVASSVVAKLPTGPSVVLSMSLIALVSLLFAPKRGMLLKALRRGKAKEIKRGNPSSWEGEPGEVKSFQDQKAKEGAYVTSN